MISAVILAGSRRGDRDAVAVSESISSKALVDIGGVTALDRVIDAVAQAGIERIVVVAAEGSPAARAAEARGVEVMTPGGGPSDSALAAFDRLGAPLLVATADHPLLRPEWILQMIGDAPGGTDAVTMLASREAVEAAIPGSKRTWLTFSDGQWSGCNLFLLRTPEARGALLFWRQVEQDRKRPWRIAMRVGPVALVRYLLGRLSTRDAFDSLGRTMGVTLAHVPARDGLAALDVDTVADLQMVRGIFADRAAGQGAR